MYVPYFSPNKIIMLGDTRSFPVQIGKYDKHEQYVIVYAAVDGKIAIQENGKLLGFVVKKIMAGGREYKLTTIATDGIELYPPEQILSKVRDLKY